MECIKIAFVCWRYISKKSYLPFFLELCAHVIFLLLIVFQFALERPVQTFGM